MCLKRGGSLALGDVYSGDVGVKPIADLARREKLR
jgi:hypothetical protein